MTIKTRRILFYASLLIFLIASPTIVLYSLGYKLDLNSLKLQKTGGIFVKIDYEDYQILINDHLEKNVKKSTFIQKGTLIPNLIPKTYNIKIEKEGYFTWEKNLKVESGLVAEVKNVFLMPKNPESKSVSDAKVKDFILSENKEILIYLSENYIFKKDLLKDSTKKISSKDYYLLKILEYSEKEDRLLAKDKNNFLSINLKTGEIIKIKKIEGEEFISLKYNPKELYGIFAISDKNILYKLDINKNTKEIILTNINNFYIDGDYLFYTTKNPTNFYKRELLSEKTTQLTFNPIKNISDNAIIVKRFGDPIAIIDNKNQLLLFNYITESFEKISDNVLDVKISSDFSKLIYRKKYELYVYYLEKSYPKKEAKDMELIGRFKNPIQKVSWFEKDNHHFILEINNSINIVELDGRDKRNSNKILDDVENFIYNSKNDYIYFIKNGLLQSIDMNYE